MHPTAGFPISSISDTILRVHNRGDTNFERIDFLQFSIGILSSDKESSLPRAASAASSCRGARFESDVN